MCRRACAVERRDADQPVHAGFGLEPAIGVRPRHLDGAGFDPGLFAWRFVDQGQLVIVLLAPARIHAQQDFGPILGLGAAGAGVDLKEAVISVGLAGQQAFQLLLGGQFASTELEVWPRPRRRSTARPRPHPVRSCRDCRQGRARFRGHGLDALVEPGSARASRPAPWRRRSTAPNPRRGRSARKGAAARFPSQRCLLSSANDLSMSSATAWISARIGTTPLSGIKRRREPVPGPGTGWSFR